MIPSPKSMSNKIETKIIFPLADRRWISLVEKNPSSVFHSPGWIKAVSGTYGFPVKAAVVERDGEYIAGLHFAAVEDELGRRVVSMAFSDFCDPVSSRRSQVTAMVKAVVREYPDHKITLRWIEEKGPPANLGFALGKTARRHLLPLASSEEDAWERTHPQFRRAVRLARKNGLTVRHLKKKELRSFYEMQLRVRKYRYGLLAQPWDFFQSIWNEIIRHGGGTFLGAFDENGAMAAAHCLLFWQDQTIYKFGASDYERPNLRANHLLHWEGIRLGVEKGLRAFDLGLSDDDQPGLIRYKRHMGADEQEIRFYLREGGDDASEARRALSEITAIATRPGVPDGVTEKIGRALYGYFA